ncbi:MULTISPECIES: 5-dehydro-4-deoxy-D-glucuronate isomerase [Treponema]|jgi:4-deoxy-L-threo-5-hexosulose-uronate ketol-isomerase|uniref:4-deoxy-L-threo-5-hexosulose-uronate ketol-isomerase n=1 Tax=Treponema rectale TaxID=744512 RepID=A0A840SEC9_9SPIR|nr:MULTISPECIES: 5-dehydro-4-deoxy-D-glucuronate isomerase [Treponema]MBB5219115.1 4-deoxy-L-threo-5-hexosulose-uronate ketol-isomerase [Treponema rectale]MBE6354634.1 5-dehydro-4-deoxy-D-glucuronate isomerase [Treponema sp.]QOS40983.1 5-dehydro-4-deoxy-D-glucuronate isomerase [Treponema rectale]
MDVRYSTGKEAFKHMTTEELRKEFLIQNIFNANDVSAVYSHVDRIVTLGAMPTTEKVDLEKNIDAMKDFGVNYFLERRELGIINIGETGVVNVDGTDYTLNHYDALYIPMGTKKVMLSSKDAAKPAKFYMNSTPAHRAFPLKLITLNDAKHVHLGSLEESNERTINQYIHPDVLDTCQLSMGLTHLEPGSVWNTMPAHTHERRMEVYFYFDIPEDQALFHFFGEPQETRHIVMHNDEAVINPSWSIHSGCGTRNYTFIWSMAGENRTYTDQDWIKTQDLR